jgi:uncharacterized membrane protein YhaH (DUF805 family)
MGIWDAVGRAFGQYVTFSGRARRAEFWYFSLFVIIVDLIAAVLDGVLFGGGVEHSGGPIGAIWGLATFLPAISVAVRRLHDTGRSGWWWWLAVIPVVGWIILIIWYATRGESGPNRFGPDPLENSWS